MNSKKRQNDRILKVELPRSVGPHMLLEIREELTQERMKREPKQKQHPLVDVTGDGSKVQCVKNNMLGP